jgi:hypothetical protein
MFHELATWLFESIRTTAILLIQVSFWLLVSYIGSRIISKAITRSIIEETTKPK